MFPVLSDIGNMYARELGIIFNMTDGWRAIFKDFFRHDLAKKNGDDSFEVPIPATLLVDRKGIVRNAYLEPAYDKRLDPSTALEWVDAL